MIYILISRVIMYLILDKIINLKVYNFIKELILFVMCILDYIFYYKTICSNDLIIVHSSEQYMNR